MKLTETDKKYILELGHEEEDFKQIEVAMQCRKTRYFIDGIRISRDEVINLIGREAYISGISRSAFHYTAARETANGKQIIFDSSRLFR